MRQGLVPAHQRVREQRAHPARLAALSPSYSHLWPAPGLLPVPSKSHCLCLHPPHRYTQPLPTGRGRLLFLEHLLYTGHCNRCYSIALGALLSSFNSHSSPEIGIDRPVDEMRKRALGSIWLHPLPCQPWPAMPSFAKLAYSQHLLVSCSSLDPPNPPAAQTSWGLWWPRLFSPSPQILAFPNSLYLWVRPRASSGWGQSPPTLPSPRSWLHHTPGLGQIQPQGDTPCKASFTAARTSPSGWGRRGLSQRLKVQPDSQLPVPVWSLPQLHAWFVGVCTEITLIFYVSAWLGSG